MRLRPAFLTLASLGLAAQTAPAPAPAAPALTWRGALWASGAASNRDTTDGSLFLRPVDAHDGSLSLDGLQFGADAVLGDGWGAKFTLLAGQAAKDLNAATLASGSTPAETGSVAWPEAMLTWTGASDTVKIGRMYTPMGMEVMDATQDATASRGLLFSFAIPFAQVGVNWHHAFSRSWSADLWVYNGEDRLQDNNRGKTAGLGLTYNAGGAADKFVSLMAFSGPEQDGLGAAADTGAEGRKRERLCMSGQWVWGKATLQWEGELARERFADPAPDGTRATWGGAGLIGKYQFTEAWAAFARAEFLKDAAGIRLAADPSVAGAAFPQRWPELGATSGALGVERRWHATFSRLEARMDHLSREVQDREGKAFSSAFGLTWSVGTTF